VNKFLPTQGTCQPASTHWSDRADIGQPTVNKSGVYRLPGC